MRYQYKDLLKRYRITKSGHLPVHFTDRTLVLTHFFFFFFYEYDIHNKKMNNVKKNKLHTNNVVTLMLNVQQGIKKK